MAGLAICLMVGAFALLVPVVYHFAPTVVLPDPLPPQHQSAENILYLALFLILVPGSVLLAPRIADRLAARDPDRAGLVVPLLGGALGVVFVLARLVDHLLDRDGLAILFALAVLWAALALLVLTRPGVLGLVARRGSDGRRKAGAAWAAAGVLAAAACLAFVTFDGLSVTALIVSLLAAALLVLAWVRFGARPGATGRWWRGLDLLVLILILVAVPDIPIYRIDELATSASDAYIANTMQFHASLFLGPVNAILHGRYLLVDTVAQYGVGSLYFIAGWFKLVPIDYGTLSLLDGILAAVVFAAGYFVMRTAGIRRAIAIVALVVTVLVLVYGIAFPIGAILQNGSIRFGFLPFSLLALWLARERWPGTAKVTGPLAWIVVGISAIWALEGFLYTSATLVGLVLLTALARPEGSPLRWILRQAGWAILAWLIAHLVFAVATLVASGELPDWGMYLTYLKEFLTGRIGDLTYDYPTWTPALAIGFGYAAGAVLLALIAWRERAWLVANRLAMIAAGGLTAYGIVQYSYFANRSLGVVIPFVTFPLILLVSIWLDRLLEHSGASRLLKGGSLAFALVLSSIAVAVAWPVAQHRATDSMLAYGLPGGKSLRGGLDRLGNMPPVVEGADEGERLLETYMPGEDASAVIVSYDLDVNILVRAKRDNSLGITDAKENGWVPGPHIPVVRRAAAQLKAGDRILLDQGALTVFHRLRRDPSLADRPLLPRYRLSIVQSQALQVIGEHYDLKPVARGRDGLVVMELVPRR